LAHSSHRTYRLDHVDNLTCEMISAELDTPHRWRFDYRDGGEPGPFTVGLYRSADQTLPPFLDLLLFNPRLFPPLHHETA